MSDSIPLEEMQRDLKSTMRETEALENLRGAIAEAQHAFRHEGEFYSQLLRWRLIIDKQIDSGRELKEKIATRIGLVNAGIQS